MNFGRVHGRPLDLQKYNRLVRNTSVLHHGLESHSSPRYSVHRWALIQQNGKKSHTLAQLRIVSTPFAMGLAGLAADFNESHRRGLSEILHEAARISGHINKPKSYMYTWATPQNTPPRALVSSGLITHPPVPLSSEVTVASDPLVTKIPGK